MKAIQFNLTIPRYLLGLAAGKYFPSLLWKGLSCTSLVDVPEPGLPGKDWALVQTRYGGICGSDMSVINLKLSLYLSPFGSFPFTFGHENTGRIAATGSEMGDWSASERVVVEPVLWCRPRGFEDLCEFCARGEINRCQRQIEGKLAPGVQTGNCKDAGGSWSAYYPAHLSQLYRVPSAINDENALMIEPFSIGMHAALQNFPKPGETVLIIGAGTIGLCTLAALRALDTKAELLVLARHSTQAEAALRLGATDVIQTKRGQDFYAEVTGRLGARLLKPMLGKWVVQGGADMTFECVGNDDSLDDALRLTRNGGRVVLVGAPGLAKDIDWTPIFVKELSIQPSFLYHHAEPFEGRKWRTFDLVISLMEQGKVDLSWMVTHRFTLDQYETAFRLQSQLGRNRAIKSVFSFEG